MLNISKFSKWPPFWARDKPFYRKWYRKLNIQERWPLAFPTFWAFDGRSSSNIEIYQFQNLIHLWPRDVTNDVMNTHLYKCIHNFIIPMHRKFNDDIFAHLFSYHEKCRYLIHKGINKADFDVTLWRHRWRHHHKKYFFLHNLGRSFHIWGQIEALFNISNFQNGRHFELTTNFFYVKWFWKLNKPERWPLAFPIFWAFDRRSSSNINGDIAISKFDPFCDLVTSSMTLWVRET